MTLDQQFSRAVLSDPQHEGCFRTIFLRFRRFPLGPPSPIDCSTIWLHVPLVTHVFTALTPYSCKGFIYPMNTPQNPGAFVALARQQCMLLKTQGARFIGGR